jgi:hypothetical protein
MTVLSRRPGGSGGSAGVSSLEGLTGAVTLSAGDGVTLTPTGNDIEIAATGSGPAIINDQILAADSLTFDVASIPNTYADLEIRFVGRCDTVAAQDLVTMRFNNDSGNNYDTQYVQFAQGNTTAGASSAQAQFGQSATTTLGFIPGSTATAGAHVEMTVWIRNYANTVFRKGFTAQAFANVTDGSSKFLVTSGGEWRNTAAITRVRLGLIGAGEFIIGSRFTLLGHGTRVPL